MGLRSPAQVEGSQGSLPQPEKDLERPSIERDNNSQAELTEDHLCTTVSGF